jgi:hypothetical protein
MLTDMTSQTDLLSVVDRVSFSMRAEGCVRVLSLGGRHAEQHRAGVVELAYRAEVVLQAVTSRQSITIQMLSCFSVARMCCAAGRIKNQRPEAPSCNLSV